MMAHTEAETFRSREKLDLTNDNHRKVVMDTLLGAIIDACSAHGKIAQFRDPAFVEIVPAEIIRGALDAAWRLGAASKGDGQR